MAVIMGDEDTFVSTEAEAKTQSLRKKENLEALAVRCPYCGAQPGAPCRVRQPHNPQYGRNYEPRDKWGNPLIHKMRINAERHGNESGGEETV